MLHRNYLLIVDDVPGDENLKNYFERLHIEIIQKNNLNPGFIEQEIPDAILINWSILKKEPAALAKLYATYPVPLIIISETTDEEACIFILESGGDDFLIKPFCVRELHAKINAIKRRIVHTQKKAEHRKDVFMFTTWKLYPASRQVFNEKNQELQLSAGEYDLLFLFVQKPQQILKRELLLQITKNRDLNPFDRRIDVQISRLRQKIDDPFKNKLIHTVRSIGYVLEER